MRCIAVLEVEASALSPHALLAARSGGQTAAAAALHSKRRVQGLQYACGVNLAAPDMDRDIQSCFDAEMPLFASREAVVTDTGRVPVSATGPSAPGRTNATRRPLDRWSHANRSDIPAPSRPRLAPQRASDRANPAS